MSEPLAQIDVVDHQGQPLLRIVGEVDMSNVRAVADELRIGIGTASTAIVDLTGLGFLDSQGLRMLHRLVDERARAGSALVIVAPPTGVAGSVLALTGMDKDLDVRPVLPT